MNFDPTYNPFSLVGKTILITGASSGIGRATAIECSKLGATCIITGRNEERLNETLAQMAGDGHISVVADISTQEGIDALVEQSPSVDGLVNNAGIAIDTLFEDKDTTYTLTGEINLDDNNKAITFTNTLTDNDNSSTNATYTLKSDTLNLTVN